MTFATITETERTYSLLATRAIALLIFTFCRSVALKRFPSLPIFQMEIRIPDLESPVALLSCNSQPLLFPVTLGARFPEVVEFYLTFLGGR
jgi:hypothetical protein